MNALAPSAAVSRRISDPVAVIGMLTATAIALLVVTVYFSVLKRFSRQERREAPASVMTPIPWPVSTGGGAVS